MLWDSARYLCSCKYELVRSLGLDGNALQSSHIGALYFCPLCQTIKCDECSNIKIRSKYCIRCMVDYTENAGQTRCLKNCFECPECMSPVDVRSSDEVSDEGRGKQFFFNCIYCSFEYETKVITRPSPLQQILKKELPDQHAKTVAKYSAMYQLNNQTKRMDTVSQSHMQRLAAMKIKEIATDNKHETTISENGPLDIMSAVPEYHQQPKGAKLAYKHSVSCGDCRHELVSPVADIKLIKILARNYAGDILPNLAATYSTGNFDDLDDKSCSLSIINNLSSSINVVVSIYGKVPASLNEEDINVSLPVSSVSIRGKRDRIDTIDTIPTTLLGSKTKAAQAQHVLRGRPTDAVEYGANWASIPFTISLKEGAAVPKFLRIPFHIEVETKLPEAWKQFSARRGLRFKYWAIVELRHSDTSNHMAEL